MIHGEDDVGVGDPPVVVARPQGTSADRFVEMIDERHVDVGVGRVARETEPNGQLQGVPVLERALHFGRVGGVESLDVRGVLHPDEQRLVGTAVPACE